MKAVSQLACIVGLSAAIATPTFAYQAGDIIIRAGATTVEPQENSEAIALNGSVLSLTGRTSDLAVDSNTQLGITASYVLDQHWAVELLAATPFRHTATATGELAGLDIADVKQLPPTLSAIYYFDSSSAFKPYLGAGINYTIFFDEDITHAADTALSGLGLTGADVALDDSWGIALQVGADYAIDDNWLVNASIRWIDINTTATINFEGGNTISSDVDLDPYVYTLAIGYKF
ncbi:OmpW/AlkL family protein [Dasania marina]|uniref:OmpW/AlkL family protein n=1 Tax=Dasania marina TaxID=471499 RepID=UPI000378F430|nr:OmpW family outer membrane protein [Dasania marina]